VRPSLPLLLFFRHVDHRLGRSDWSGLSFDTTCAGRRRESGVSVS